MKSKKPKPRRFKGFVAIDRRGAVLWGTMRPNEAEARAIFEKWNPDPTGKGTGVQIVPIDILIRN